MTTSTMGLAGLILAGATALLAQKDPGPRAPEAGAPQAGVAIRGLTAADLQTFTKGLNTFQQVETVATGLGPRFNLDSCAGCHANPAVGGTSPEVNPQLAAGVSHGASNQIPPFLTSSGPVRVVRFQQQPNGEPDGGVHDLFVITGRGDAPAGCSIAQPDFSNPNHLSFRIPTPVFGLGLIEAISDATLKANLAANAETKRALGIQGRFNTSANDGSIARFGWKAQNQSLLLFSGEAYNVEMGVTNELFPQEREDNPACATNPLPEDATNLVNGQLSDIESFGWFMRLLAPPPPGAPNPSTNNGRQLFASTGCALCHTPTLQSGKSSIDGLSNQAVNLYSDLAIHNMGQGLNDGITQGQANGQQFRSAPLWGLGTRIYLLHDGRTTDLIEAILDHDSQGSEAHQVIQNYEQLTSQQKQDLLNFLRSL